MLLRERLVVWRFVLASYYSGTPVFDKRRQSRCTICNRQTAAELVSGVRVNAGAQAALI